MPGIQEKSANANSSADWRQFAGQKIANIYDYTYALRSRKPGQSVRITVKRSGQELDLTATLGRRP